MTQSYHEESKSASKSKEIDVQSYPFTTDFEKNRITPTDKSTHDFFDSLSLGDFGLYQYLREHGSLSLQELKDYTEEDPQWLFIHAVNLVSEGYAEWEVEQ